MQKIMKIKSSNNIISSSSSKTIFVSFAKKDLVSKHRRKHRDGYSDYSSSNNEIQEKRSEKRAWIWRSSIHRANFHDHRASENSVLEWRKLGARDRRPSSSNHYSRSFKIMDFWSNYSGRDGRCKRLRILFLSPLVIATRRNFPRDFIISTKVLSKFYGAGNKEILSFPTPINSVWERVGFERI